MYLPPQVNTALDLLHRAGYEAFLVGGAVRDHVRDGRQGTDWDLTTNALPHQVQQVFSAFRLIETGLKHGTVTVLMDGEPLEITTYRVDGAYSDHRRPDSVQFTPSLREDLARRDFTMNALAYNPRVGLVDPFGGVEDIRRGLVRCVGRPDRRFQEDALRILRALRFAAVHALTIEEETSRAIHDHRHLLQSIAAERVQSELTRLLCGSGAAAVLRSYGDVLAAVIPELAPMFGLQQHTPHHDRDVWEHTIAAVEASPADPVLRWSALLHDVGKPRCFSLDADGVGHFYRHASVSAELTDAILARLRFDNHSRAQITLLVKNHDTPLPTDSRGIRRLMNRLGPQTALQLIDLHRADTAGQHPDCAVRYGEFDLAERLVRQLMEADACFSLKDLAINGKDLLALGARGRRVGDTLRRCLEAVMDDRVENRREALLDYAAHVLKEEIPMTDVVAALIWEGDRFLICQRPAHKARGLLWEFVGGKVEPGETKEQALIRECREELDVTIRVGELFMEVVHPYPDLTVRLSLFHAEIAHGTPKLLEHNDLRWITVEQIPQQEFCPADVEILAALTALKG